MIFSTKGGVGKTVVAANVAVSLAQRTRKPVCLVDLDVMAVGDISRMLNVTTNRSIVDAMPVLKRAVTSANAAASAPKEGPAAVVVPTSVPELISLEGIMAPHSSGVHVLAGVSSPRQIGQLDQKALALLFQLLKKRYDYVIVDGGKAFSEPLIAAFDAANLVLLVASPDIITLYQTKWALGMFESLLFPSMMVKAVLNRADSRGGIGTQDARVALTCEVIAEIPSDGRVVGTSVNQGVPLVLAFGHTKIAEAFSGLAQTLMTRGNLYIDHHDVARHRPEEATQGLAQESGMWSSRLYNSEDGTDQIDESIDELVIMKRRIHERLVEELDLKKLDLSALVNRAQMLELREKTERVVTNLLAREMGGLIGSQEVRARLVKEIVDEALGLGSLEELLADPEITDILVNNKDQVYVERHGKLYLTSKKFISNDQVRAVIERIVTPLGRRIDEATPMVDARLPDGSRVNAIIPPLSLKGPVLSIRKFARVRYTQDDLMRLNSVSAQMVDFIGACVLARKNMIISGGTGSGKTTLLNIVSAFIPEGERIITIEDAAELKLMQTHWVNLESRPPNIEGKGSVAIRDLFRNALRMRPDRIIIGECRGGESLDMLQAMNTGHDGSMTTIHANSPKDVISRLDSMVLMSNVDLPIRAIREMVSSAISIIVHTARLSDGSRKITAISELIGMTENSEILFQDLFLFQQSGVGDDGSVLGQFVATGHLPTFFHDLKVKGLTVDEAMFKTTAPVGKS